MWEEGEEEEGWEGEEGDAEAVLAGCGMGETRTSCHQGRRGGDGFL